MISVSEARERVVSHLFRLGTEPVALADSLGRVLASDAAADLDMPPFDKSCMDGFAVLAADLADGEATLEILETVRAGSLPTQTVRSGTATRIMTGAPLPEGADAVVMVEKSRTDQGKVTLGDTPSKCQNIQPRGELFSRGDVLLTAGSTIRPAEMSLLAMIGQDHPTVYRRPTVTFISTGDELVAVDRMPGPGEIRDSNSYGLKGLVESHGGVWSGSRVVSDDTAALRAAFEEGLEDDILLISGGVSAGDYDLVEDVLADLGMTKHFDKVALKPGKPAVFGTRGKTLVYGLPGNPVSGFVVFLLFGGPAVRHLSGRDDLDLPRIQATLEGPLGGRTIPREQYLPARLRGGNIVENSAWQGSSDMLSMTRANCLLVVPAGAELPTSGDTVEVLIWHDLFG